MYYPNTYDLRAAAYGVARLFQPQFDKLCRACCLVAILVLGVTPAISGAQNIVWSDQFAGPNDETGEDVAVFGGTVYVVGQNDAYRTSSSDADSFSQGYIRGFDTEGNRIWSRGFGNSEKDKAIAVTANVSGLYVAGTTSATPANKLNPDVLLARYDLDGRFLWQRQFGVMGPDEPLSVAVDETGVYVVGAIGEGMEGFVRKYDVDGNLLWALTFGGNNSWFDYASGVIADGEGVYVTGVMSQSFVEDAFVRRYDPNGNEVWTRQFGSDANDRPRDIALDQQGIYIVGNTRGNLATGEPLPFGQEAFVRSYDFDGAVRWSNQFYWDDANAVTTGGERVYLVGDYSPEAGKVIGVITTLDSQGTEYWSIGYGGSPQVPGSSGRYDPTLGVAFSDEGVFAVGRTNGPFLGNFYNGGLDGYLLKFSLPDDSARDSRQLVVCPGDIDSDGFADVAAVMVDGEVIVRGLNKAEVSRFSFTDLPGVEDIVLLADSDGNGAPELAALGVAEYIDPNSTEAAVLSQVNDLRTGQRVSVGVRNDGINFPVDIEAVMDIDGSGVQELAHLGQSGNKVKVKDALSKKWINTVPFTNRFVPVDLEVFPDIDNDGVADLGVLGDNKMANKSDNLQVRSLVTGEIVWQLSMSKYWTVLKQELIADINANGFPEVAILRVDYDSRKNQYIIFDTSPSRQKLATVGLDKNFEPTQLLAVPDMNANGADELVIYGHHRHNNGQKALVYDSKSGKRIRTVYFDSNFAGRDIAVCDDINGNGAVELVLLGQRDSDGKMRAIIKDARSGTFVGKVDF